MYIHSQEGPHSTLPEDEFFDAVETGLDKIEEDRQLRVRLKLQSQQVNLIYFFSIYIHMFFCVFTRKWLNNHNSISSVWVDIYLEEKKRVFVLFVN